MYEELIRILQQAGLGEHSDIPNIPRIAPVSQVAHFWWRRQYIAMQRIWLAGWRKYLQLFVFLVDKLFEREIKLVTSPDLVSQTLNSRV